MLIPSSAKQATILTTQQIYPQYKSLIHLSSITTSFQIFIHFIIIEYHLHSSLLLTFTPSSNSSQTEPGESVIFQPVLQAYPTRHSWIITVHVSLGNLECHWKLFNRQLTRTQQFLRSFDQHPSAPTQLLTTLQLELANIQDIYKSSETTITSAINLLNSNQLQTNTASELTGKSRTKLAQVKSRGLVRTLISKALTAQKNWAEIKDSLHLKNIKCRYSYLN